MNYIGNIFRPPAEHDSVLLQVTTGCSNNQCAFCGMYKDKRFSIKAAEVINADIDYAAAHFKDSKRIFLCDGDALIIPFDRLLEILDGINRKLPWITRIGLYGNAKSIKSKSDNELLELKKRKLGIIYMGLESGDDDLLKQMRKGVTAAEQILQGQRVRESGIKLSVTVLLGLGGRESERHAIATGKALSAIKPNYIGALSLIVTQNTPLFKLSRDGTFSESDPAGLLRELALIIENTDVPACVFSANHASNHLPVQFRLPGEKAQALRLLEEALAGKKSLKPEWLRGL